MSIRRSVTPDYLICLDDGRQFKSLRRHLGALGMTPEQYRQKWNLPSDYPMVASNYAAQRSAFAKARGFGQLRTKPVAAVLASADTIEVAGPATVAKSKAKKKAAATSPQAATKRKLGRPRKMTT